MIVAIVGGAAVVVGVIAALVLNTFVLPHAPQTRPPAIVTQPPVESTATPLAPPASPAESSPPSASPTNSPKQSPSSAPDFAKVADKVKSGIVRVIASTCAGSGIGTGFLIDDQTVVVAAESVAEAVSTVAIIDGDPVPATVTSVEAKRGVALLKLDRPVDGYQFVARKSELAKGQPVGIVGIPESGTTTKLITASVADPAAEFSDGSLDYHDLGQLAADADPGLGGAPLVDGDGAVIGMIFTHQKAQQLLILPGDLIEPAISDPSGDSVGTGKCDRPLGPATDIKVSGKGSEDLKAALRDYFANINVGDYQGAYRDLGPNTRRSTSASEAEAGWISTYDFNIVIKSASGSGSQSKASVTFDSIFRAGNGPEKSMTCARWSLDYSFAAEGGRLLLNGAAKAKGKADYFEKC